MTINRFELAPAAINPPYPGGPFVGCAAAVAQDFVENYTPERIPDLGVLFASMTQRHRNVDRTCVHGLRPHGACAYCIFLELYARGLPVAYGPLAWDQIVGLMDKGCFVAIPGLYTEFPTVAADSYSSTMPAGGRSDTYAGAHMVGGFGRFDAGIRSKVLDPDFGNARGTPPYSDIPTDSLRAFWQTLGSYPVCYASKAPGGAAPSHQASVKTPSTHLFNPVTKAWRYSLRVGTVLTVGGHATAQGATHISCYPVRGPNPYTGYWVPVANARLLP